MSTVDELTDDVKRQVQLLTRYLKLAEAAQSRDATRIAVVTRDLAAEFPEWAAAVYTTAAGAAQALAKGPVEPAELRRLGQLVHALQSKAAAAIAMEADR